VAPFESRIQRQRRQRGRRQTPESSLEPAIDTSEWDEVPLGSLGTRLWADIELYLEFLDIARSEPDTPRARRAVTDVSTRHAAYLRFL
jgi:hypothetical protein